MEFVFHRKIKIYPTIIFKNTLWYWNTACFLYSKNEI